MDGAPALTGPPGAYQDEWGQIIWAAYWSSEVAERLGLLPGFTSGKSRDVATIATALRTLAPRLERDETLRARRLAVEIARLFK